jgi:hypothetical protein
LRRNEFDCFAGRKALSFSFSARCECESNRFVVACDEFGGTIVKPRFARRSESPFHPRRIERVARVATALCILTLSSVAMGCASETTPTAVEEDRPGQIEPRYQPREPLEEPFYDTTYLFGMTRGVTNSTIHPGAQIPLLVLTIPLDIVFLPFAAIGGFF